MKVVGKGTKKEATVARWLLMDIIGRASLAWLRQARRSHAPMVRNPNMIGSTDSSQRMIDFTEAHRLDLPAGEVDKYKSSR